MIFPSFSLTPGASAPFCRSQGSLSFRRCKDTMFPKYRPSEKETVCVNGHVLLICINVLGVLLTLFPCRAERRPWASDQWPGRNTPRHAKPQEGFQTRERGAPTTKGSVSVARRAKQARGDARLGMPSPKRGSRPANGAHLAGRSHDERERVGGQAGQAGQGRCAQGGHGHACPWPPPTIITLTYPTRQSRD